MTFILLTGAGFSRNWGGPLAADVFSGLLADKDIDSQTRDLLFDSGGNFERVLADLQLSPDPANKKRYDVLVTAVVGLFNGMNQTFMHQPFEFENPPQVTYSLQSFLSRFHAMFTLNQDALVELHYSPIVGGSQNWGRLHLPGLKYPGNFQPSGSAHDRLAVMEPNPSDFKLAPSIQPYIKLHGSVNWVESSMGERIIVMGGEKAVSVGRFPILSWYHQEFRAFLLRAEARLMVIGYSFSDAHINNAIVDGLKVGLKLFVVDPGGMKVLENEPRMASFRSQIIGFSTRPISSTFGGDRYQHLQLSKFFS